MKNYRWLILAMVLLAVGCQKQPIDKQEADAIVTKYVNKHFKSDDRTERAVWYYKRLDDERIELSFWIEGDEDIIAENAFVYYIDENWNMGDMFPHPHRIILVQKKSGKYTVFQRSTRPCAHPWGPWENDWALLYMFADGQFWNQG